MKCDVVQLGELCRKVVSGGTPKSTVAEFYDGNIPWLNTKEIHFNRISQTERTISILGLENSSAKWIPANCVIVAMYGATAGNVAINRIPMTTNQACCNLEIDETRADYRFIYYYLKSKYMSLSSLANGGAQQNLSAKLIKDFPIVLPPLDTQAEIADLLWILDDKIELNNKINANLEQQAQALFKAWFVGNSFNNKGTLGDIAEITMGQSPSGNSYNEDGKGSVFYQGRSEFGFRFPTRRLFTTEPKRMARAGDLLLSVRAPVGDLNVAYENCCIGRGLCALHSRDNMNSFLLYALRSLKPTLDVFNGEGTVFGSISKDDLIKIPVSIPCVDDMARFEAIVRPMDDLIRSNYEANCRLQIVRNNLLPKLMSGEIV